MSAIEIYFPGGLNGMTFAAVMVFIVVMIYKGFTDTDEEPESNE